MLSRGNFLVGTIRKAYGTTTAAVKASASVSAVAVGWPVAMCTASQVHPAESSCLVNAFHAVAKSLKGSVAVCEMPPPSDKSSTTIGEAPARVYHITGSTRPSFDYIPSALRESFILMCCLAIVGVWLAAAFGPLFMIYSIYHRAWDFLLTFLCVWLWGGLVRVPHMPTLAEAITTGIESWFSRFSITYEHLSSALSIKRPAKTPGGPTIYCYHPHGLFSFGTALLAVDLIRRGEKVSIVTSSHMRWFNPVLKILLDVAGIEIVGSSRNEVEAAMKRGDRSLILVPGGYEEGVMTQTGFERLFLKDRLGFVKFAMRYGYSLTPVYAYGENDLYTCIPVADKLRNLLATWKIPVAIFYGDSSMPLLPKRTGSGLRIVVGAPVYVDSDSARLREAHSEYVERLVQLYYRYNEDSDRPIEIT